MIYAFIDQHANEFPIEQCCRTMKVSRSAFFAWRQRQANPTSKMLDDADLAELIAKIHDQSHGTYGVPRVTAELRLGLGRRVNHKRVQRLMHAQGLQGVTRRRRGKGCTRTRVGDPRSDDLVKRQFRPDRPNRLWVQDITQHRTGEGWVYMAVVIDAWSRRVVGWSIADHLRAELVVDALEMARLRRQPDGTIVHSDHGTQGGFNWSSQHLDVGGVCWGRTSRRPCGRIGDRSRRLAGRRSRGGGTVSGSGPRSHGVTRPRPQQPRRVCHPRSRSGGSATLAA